MSDSNGDGTTSKEISSSMTNLQHRNIELQTVIERQSKELTESRIRLGELQAKLKDYEEKFVYSDDKMSNLSKELLGTIDSNKKIQRDLKEALALKDEQEQRISSLEQRYINLQRECSSLNDMNNRLETELAIRENSLKHGEERYRNLQAKLETFEQKYEQLHKRSQSSNVMSNNSTDNNNTSDLMPKNITMAQFQEKHMNIEEKLHSAQNELEDAKMELTRAKQREKMSEDHNTRLTQTVDKLLSESNERLQMHLKERMHSLDEKNTLTQECDKLRKQIDDLDADKDKISLEIETLKSELDLIRKENQSLHIKIKDLTTNYANALKLNTTLSNSLQTVTANAAAAAKKQQQSTPVNSASINTHTPTHNNGVHNNSNANVDGSNYFGEDGLDFSYASANQIFYQPMSVNTNNNNNGGFASNFNLNSTNSLKNAHTRSTRPQYNYAQHAKLLSEQNRIQNLIEANNLQQQQQQQQNQFLEQKSDECNWDKLDEAAKVIANVQHAFEISDCEINELNNILENKVDNSDLTFQVKKISFRIGQRLVYWY